MKKSKLLILGIIALLLAGGLAVVGCGDVKNNDYCPNGRNNCSSEPTGSLEPDCANLCISKKMNTGTWVRASCDCTKP